MKWCLAGALARPWLCFRFYAWCIFLSSLFLPCSPLQSHQRGASAMGEFKVHLVTELCSGGVSVKSAELNFESNTLFFI